MRFTQFTASMTRSFPAPAALAAVLMASATGAWAQTTPIAQGTITVKLQPLATIPTADGPPQDLVTANDGTGRRFVTTRNGRIRVIDADGTLNATTYLNLNAAIGNALYTAGEGGFPGLAFSPNFTAAANVPGSGKFYTFTTENYVAGNVADFSHPELLPAAGGATPANQIVIREWTASAPGAATATGASRVLLRLNHPQNNHQGGGLKFGPDGNLYISLGDGGGGNDFNGSATSTTDGHTNSVGNGQDTTNPLGKILRINPTGTGSANGQYGSPAGNPFASGAGGSLKEIYAYGLRNPFRISFDDRPGGTGNLFAADVGQSAREEVDIIAAGGNYGWPFREGTRNNAADAGRTTPVNFSALAPIAEYTHGDGNSIIGGFVYRGSLLPLLVGKYVFGDFQGTGGVGRLFYTDAAGGGISELKYDLTAGGLTPPSPLFGFGQDANGELYGLFSNGQVVQIVPEPTGLALAAIATAPLFARKRRSA